jgi:hypothetical protein
MTVTVRLMLRIQPVVRPCRDERRGLGSDDPGNAPDRGRRQGPRPDDGSVPQRRRVDRHPAYNRGAEAIRAYLDEEVVGVEESLFWDLPVLDIFLRTGDAIGFSGDGRITVTPPVGSALAFPFRLAIVAEHADGRWLIRQFHGSLPSAT